MLSCYFVTNSCYFHVFHAVRHPETGYDESKPSLVTTYDCKMATLHFRCTVVRLDTCKPHERMIDFYIYSLMSQEVMRLAKI